MTQFEEQLKKLTNTVQLSNDERSRMREQLLRYMEHTPVRRTQAMVHAVPSPFSVFSLFRAHHLSGALIIALVTSGFGMTYAAADALPGDVLYTVKVDVNEAVIGAFIANEEKQIAWERERAERRLEEASQLALEGRLDSGRKEEISRRFAQHTESMVKRVLALGQADPVLAAEVSNEFEAALDTHEVVLARLLVEQETETSDEAKELVSQVRSVAMRVNEIAHDAEEQITDDMVIAASISAPEPVSISEATSAVTSEVRNPESTDSPNMRIRAVQRLQERASEHLAQAETQVTKLDQESDVFVHAQAQVDINKKRIQEGERYLERGDMGGAYTSFRSASLSLQKVGQLLEAATLFNVSILEGVDASRNGTEGERLDDGVKSDELLKVRDEIQGELTEVRSKLLASEGLTEQEATRANGLVKDAMAHVLRAEIALVLDQESKARELLTHAERLAKNAHTIVDQAPQPDDVKEPVPNKPSVNTGTSAPLLPELPVMTPPRLDVVTVYHEFEGTTHTFSGVYYTPTPCFALTADAVVAESMPEQVTLALTAKDEGGVCAMVIDRKAFSVKVEASAGATLKGVTVNGSTSKFEVVEGPNDEIFEEAPVIPVQSEAIPATPEVGSGTATQTSNLNVFERTLKATTDLLR